MPATSATPCFKFIVRSADEAAAMIRERLGGQARVLSVRNVEAAGLARFWSGPRLEIIAQSAPTESDPVAPAIPPPGPAAHRTDLRALLQRSGFSGKMLDRLVRSPDWPDLASRPLHEGLVETGRTLSRWYGPRFTGEPLARAAFIGLPGSGRTTALCKLLALETFRRGRRGHVVMVEFDRLNPAGTLQVFGEVLGLPVSHFPAAPRQPAPGGFVYYDLPGLSLREPAANRSVADFLDEQQIIQRVLVLNAAYEPGVLTRACAAGCDLGATHVVFTHLDEMDRWGRLWDYVLDGGLEPLLLSTGPSLTGDCEHEVLDALVRRTLPLADEPEPEDGRLGSAA